MIVGERSANGHIDVEAAVGCIEDEFWGHEGVVFVQLQFSMVEAIGVRPL